ncbi:MAG: glycosyltransferase family 39 protein [Candidatus Acidiferrales bacterium]
MMSALPATVAVSEGALDRDAAFRSRLMLLALACGRLFIQFAGINHYGFFRDELYYMACGEHLAWGYVDQPPLIAFVAWFARHVLGTSLFATRLLPALAGAAVVYVTGRVAAELGGGLLAQFLAAVSILFAPAFLAFDSFLSMNAFEPLFWVLCAWIAIRIVRGASPRWWLLFGAVAGLGLENKHSMLVFGFALVAGLLLAGQASPFRWKWIWFGGAVALVIFLPNLFWEARHGWPQIEVVRNAQHFKNEPIGPLQFLFEQVLFLGPLALPVWLTGLLWYFISPEGKRFRFLGCAYLLVLGVFMIFHGKSYYVLPVYPVLMAAGGVALAAFFAAPRRRWLAFAFPAALAAAGLLTLPFGVPFLQVATFLRYSNWLGYAHSVRTERDATAALPQLYADMFGWENMAAQIADVYHALPESEQAGCAILAGNYGEAGAIDRFGPALGLPKAISGHNSYYFWGPRQYSGACVILFGERAAEHSHLFAESQLVATITNPDAAIAERNVQVYVCHKPLAPLAVLWPQFKMII